MVLLFVLRLVPTLMSQHRLPLPYRADQVQPENGQLPVVAAVGSLPRVLCAHKGTRTHKHSSREKNKQVANLLAHCKQEHAVHASCANDTMVPMCSACRARRDIRVEVSFFAKEASREVLPIECPSYEVGRTKFEFFPGAHIHMLCGVFVLSPQARFTTRGQQRADIRRWRRGTTLSTTSSR